MTDRLTLGLCFAFLGFAIGIACLLAAAVWYLTLYPEPWALALVGVGAMVIGTGAAVLTVPSPHEMRAPPPPPPDPTEKFRRPRPPTQREWLHD